MKQKHCSSIEARRVVGGGGSFCVCYCDADGQESSAVFWALGITYVPHQGCFLVCREGWLPLSSVRQIQPHDPAAH